MRAMVVFKVHSSGRQSQFTSQRIEAAQAGLFTRSQVKVQNVRQITAAETGIQAQTRRFGIGNGTGTIQTALLGLTQRLLHAAQIDAFTYRPHCIDEWQTCPVEPLLTEIKSMRKTGQTSTHGA